MEFMHRGITLSIGDDQIRQLVIERLAQDRSSVCIAARQPCPPRIGESWIDQGGVYAGVVRGRNGAPDTHLIIGPAYDGELPWDEANNYAKGIRVSSCSDGLHSFTDWRLMYRPEGAVAYANVPELFGGKPHWTCEQPAEYSSLAWVQYFLNGHQLYWNKNHKFRARAVRSAIIQ